MTPKERYDKDGFYIHSKSTIPQETLERAAFGLAQVREGIYDTDEKPDGRGWKPGDDPGKLCKIEQPQLANSALRQVICSPILGQLAGEVTGANSVQVWWVQGLYKPGTSSIGNVGWHQDKSYWSEWEDSSGLFTAWLALSDVKLESGPMVFVPGSHHWGLIKGGDFFSQDHDTLRKAIHIPEGEKWQETADIMPPGGVSFHHQMLFHGSFQNTSTIPRLSLAIHLKTEKSKINSNNHFARYLNRTEICPVIYKA